MRALDAKLVRDLRRLGLQAIALVVVMASGAAVLVIGSGTARSLERTSAAFYERYRFGDVFASLTRAPLALAPRIAAIDGVSAVEARVTDLASLDIPGMLEPASALLVSLPAHGEPSVNRLYLRRGRLPDAARPDEVALNERFANAHGFEPGDGVVAIIDGKRRELRVTGVVLSPEYVYALGPGDMMPNAKRFGVLFLPRPTLEAALDMRGAFNDVALTLRRDADERAVTEALDDLLAPYGGTGAHPRAEQLSAAFVDGELEQLNALAAVIPPVFLFVSAFLVNMILSRLIALEREQIGLLKAIGYSDAAVALHYVKLVAIIAVAGAALGIVLGTLIGEALTRLYVKFYAFPFLLFDRSFDLYALAIAVTLAAALVGAASAIRQSVALAPAVAMAPPVPPRYRRASMPVAGDARRERPDPRVSRLDLMAVRHLVRWPLRSALTVLGTSFGVALLVLALFTYDSIDVMLETIFAQGNRQDATLAFASDRPTSAATDIAAWPGVLRAEPFRSTPVVLRHGHREKRLVIVGLPPDTELARPLDDDFLPLGLPPAGVAISAEVADILDARIGDILEAVLQAEGDRTVSVPVTAVVRDWTGLPVYARLDVLDALLDAKPRVSGVHVQLDEAALPSLYARVKDTPAIPAVALLGLTLESFRETVETNISYTMSVYVTLAIVIAFGVIYNAARIQLSERARELASLRIFGFTRAEVSRVLILELGIVVVIAQPLGWLFGHGFARAVTEGFRSDLYRLPFVIDASTYAVATLVVAAAAALSLAIVRRRIDRLDLVATLKTRE